MISPRQNEAFENFLATVKDNGVLDEETTILAFLTAALAIRCRHCAERFIDYAKNLGISDEKMGAAAAIAMCVRAGSARALAFEIAEAQD
ncbi:MAG: carboxymuconolactone decarboxylase family protein [Proteobacteria bacterium]|nr:carboxymuconolactone decarboxylase family protein [Pseudomonadota bacterium]MBU4275554.1 carboxymuconolactone decarboxylase family protein [Pseudomonadota bacterium]MBU4382831.1 carboxymuconolactone decarboxylase family protein [Pseudomonadota bacterium]MBU4606698.1 carboxymuconolactone decarboxylase family protein [Pseudomonadota bacterium]MCG2765346.1 carboxymuconolactone decarboxylase family protein [Desulfarculaceae bacterium]